MALLHTHTKIAQCVTQYLQCLRVASKYSALLMFVGLTSTCVYCADEIRPFTSDGCSAFPDGTLENNKLWLSCCTDHDLAYWAGGSYQQRVEADKSLRQCVASVGEPVIAELMLMGVRVGGTPYFPTKFRWGYGWTYPRGYKEINQREKHNIQLQLELRDKDI